LETANALIRSRHACEIRRPHHKRLIRRGDGYGFEVVIKLFKQLRIWLGAIMSGLLLAGCVSGPKISEYRATLPPPPAGMGRIWFYRHSLPFGVMVEPAIELDGTNVGYSIPGAFFQVEIPPGVHEVSTFTEAKYKTTVTVNTNADSYVKFYILPGALVGRIIPTVVDEVDALRGLEGLRYAKTIRTQR
jgi:hypothetical protein